MTAKSTSPIYERQNSSKHTDSDMRSAYLEHSKTTLTDCNAALIAKKKKKEISYRLIQRLGSIY